MRGVVHTELQLPKGFHIDAGWIGLTLTWLGKGKKKQRLFIQLYQAEIHCVAAAVACCVTKVCEAVTCDLSCLLLSSFLEKLVSPCFLW